jgi:hypothetical protein
MDDWQPIINAPESDSPIREEFDPTWPYNFKWAMDKFTGQTQVWRVNGGTDGRPYQLLSEQREMIDQLLAVSMGSTRWGGRSLGTT